MVSSQGRRSSSRRHAQVIDLSPLIQRPRRSRPQLSAASENVEVEGAAEDSGKTTYQTATAASVSETLPSLADHEPTLTASSSRSLACHICLEVKDAIRKPVVTYCGHLFCWRCLLKQLPSEGPSHDEVMLSCPVCRSPLCGLSSNKNVNTIITLYRKNPATDCSDGDDEQPLPKPNAYPIWVFDEKVQMFHETAQKLKSAEEHFTSMLDQSRESRSSIGKHMQQIKKCFNRQLSISDDAE